MLGALTTCTAAASSTGNLAEAVGVYRFADGSAAALVDQDGALRLVDYRTGALRQLEQRTPALFVGGPGVSVPAPVSVRVTLGSRRGGNVASLRVDGQAATRIPLVTRPAAFGGGGVRLAGRLILPAGKGPFPAVVIVPGSVPAHRDTYDLWALFFASRGFAALTYDKRGVGNSTGQYIRAATDENLRNLASDALAGVAWLRGRRDIDPRRIGLSGGSQAGWVIALAASRSRSVRSLDLTSFQCRRTSSAVLNRRSRVNTCGCRRISFSACDRATSSRLNRPCCSAIFACSMT